MSKFQGKTTEWNEMSPDVDDELLAVFQDEGNELIRNIMSNVQSLRSEHNQLTLNSVYRDLHTLKGCAQLINHKNLYTITHMIESIFKKTSPHELLQSPQRDTLVDQSLQYMMDVISLIHTKKSPPTPIKLLDSLGTLIEHSEPENLQPIPDSTSYTQTAFQENLPLSKKEPLYLKFSFSDVEKIAQIVHELMRTQSDQEWQFNQIESHLAQLNASTNFSAYLFNNVTNTLEHQPSMPEIQNKLQILSESIDTTKTQVDLCAAAIKNHRMLAVHQNKLAKSLDEKLFQSRLTEFSKYVPRLEQIVEQASQIANKRIALITQKIDAEVDRCMIEKLIPAFEHIIRNAIDHGIEPADVRIARNKPSVGQIQISLRRIGHSIVFDFRDDGGGLDLESIRQKAVERQLINKDETLSQQAAIALLLQPGFSTRNQVSLLSGRGIGMDVVNHIVQHLGGQMSVSFQKGMYTNIQIRLPAAISQHSSIVFESNKFIYAINTLYLAGVARLSLSAPDKIPNQTTYAGKNYPLYKISDHQTPSSTPKMTGTQSQLALMINYHDGRFALLVDKVLGSRNLVIQPMMSIAPIFQCFQGVAQLSEGGIAYCIEPAQFHVLADQKGHEA